MEISFFGVRPLSTLVLSPSINRAMYVIIIITADDTVVPRSQRRASMHHTDNDDNYNSDWIRHSQDKGQLGAGK